MSVLTRWIRRLSRGQWWFLAFGISVGMLGGALLHASRTSGVVHASGFERSKEDYRARLEKVPLTPGATVTFELWIDRMNVRDDFPVTADLAAPSGTRKRLQSKYRCDDPGITEGAIFRFGDFVPKDSGPWQIEATVPADVLPELTASLAVRDRAFDWTWFSICLLVLAVFCVTITLISQGDTGKPATTK